MKRVFFIILGCLFLIPAASAHEIRPAFLQITASDVPGDYDLVWKQPILADKKLRIAPILPASCQREGGGPGERTAGALIERWRVSCGATGLEGKTLVIEGLERTMIDVFVEIVSAAGASRSLIVKPRAPSFVMAQDSCEATSSGLSSYLRLGVEHLLTGFDHILFVIALVLLVRTPMKLIKVITSFTIAHSLTLGLSTLGLVSLSQGAVEAVIALSIIFLAVELASQTSHSDSLLLSHPWAITFVFGLLHGFGFAGALAEIGLPQGTAALALLLFNLGVEAGQLIIVAVVLGALFVLRSLPVKVPGELKPLPAYAIGSLAGFWFIERMLQLVWT